MTSIQIQIKKTQVKEVNKLNGKCINLTEERLYIYGPRYIHEAWDDRYENTFYVLEKGESTPDDFDCDGFFVPNDRVVAQVSMPTVKGPCAVKFRDHQTFTITQDGNHYVPDSMNFGVFKIDEVCFPSDWPRCVAWPIVDEPYSYVKRNQWRMRSATRRR